MKPAALADAILGAPAPPVRLPSGISPASLIWGTVSSIQAGPPPTLTVTLAGSTTTVAGVGFFAAYSPIAGDTVAMIQVGSDLVVVDRLQAFGSAQQRPTNTDQVGGTTASSGTNVLTIATISVASKGWPYRIRAFFHCSGTFSASGDVFALGLATAATPTWVRGGQIRWTAQTAGVLLGFNIVSTIDVAGGGAQNVLMIAQRQSGTGTFTPVAADTTLNNLKVETFPI